MTEPLCPSCRCLDFEQIVNNTKVPPKGIEIVDIGKRVARDRKTACVLCSFFHQLRANYTKKFGQHVRLFSCLDEGYYYDSVQKKYSKNVSNIPQYPFFCVLRKNSRLSYDHALGDEVRSAGVACYISRENQAAFQIHAVDPANANWPAITRQLAYCNQNHSICQRKEAASSRLEYIFLIDCVTGNIVKGNLNDNFLALSYVWGPQKPQSEFSPTDSFSLQDVPSTIRDAVKAVLKLGRRYLWVDRYCIDQRDESEKKKMIESMDLIYESSDATLVALHGDHDQSGLPGVSAITRTPQPIFDTGKGQLVYSFPAIMSLIEGSKWNTRGWTYQEARLSRRCLYFSHFQVHFVCRHSTWSEAVPFDPGTNWITKILNSQKLDGALFGVDTHDGWWRDRLEFSKRNLSHETDEMNAFRGILRRSSFITLWGIPVIPEKSDIDPNVGFSLGLLWTKRPMWRREKYVRNRQRVNSYRRCGFPTWSWTSLHADICQDMFGLQSKYGQYLLGNSVCFPENEANIKFWCLVDDRPLSLQSAIEVATSPLLPEYTQELQVEGQFIKTSPQS